MNPGLEELLEATVRREGFALYHWTLKPSGRRPLLRIFLHSEAGVSLDDCARVSKRLGAAIEEARAIEGSYVLEVSSPGLDRPLLRPWHYETALGQRVRLVQQREQEGRRRIEGVLLALVDDELRLEVEGREERLALDSICQARVLPDYSPGRARGDDSHGGKR